MQELVSEAESKTLEIAEDFTAKFPKHQNLICLFGDLGSGKTVFVKGIAKALGIEDYSIKSPTYTFIREYPHKKGRLVHIDLYRLETPDDILLKQIEEFYSDPSTLVVIEWADKMRDDLPSEHIDICFEYIDGNTRKITIF